MSARPLLRSVAVGATVVAMTIGGLVQGSSAVPVVGPPSAPTIAAGYNHSVIIAPNGKPYAIGTDNLGATGQGGPDVDSLSPMLGLPGQVKAVTVAAGFETTLVVGSDGVPYATGYQSVGELGVGGSSSVFSFQPMSGLPQGVSATAVAAGMSFFLVLGSDGVAYGVGRNVEGQITGASTSTRTALSPLTGLPQGRKAVAIAAGIQHSVVLDDLGQVYGTGADGEGQITGSTNRTTLTPFADMPADVQILDIAAKGNHTVMLGSDGFAYAVGQNAAGQLGIGDVDTPQRSPLQMLGSGGAVDVASGVGHTLVLTGDGDILGTGAGLTGQIGGSSSVHTLQLIPMLASPTGPSPMVEASGGTIHTLTIDAAGVVWGTGSNDYGQAIGQVTGNTQTLTSMLAQPTFSIAPPIVSGTPRVGKPLQVSDGEWWPAATEFSYQWERAEGGGFVSSVDSYTPVLADAGKTIYVRVTGTRPRANLGSAFATNVRVPLFSLTKPSITGVIKVGSTLKAKKGKWAGSPATFKYSWLRAGKPISGAKKATYTLKKADRGRKIKVQVTAKKPGSASGVASSAVTRKVK